MTFQSGAHQSRCTTELWKIIKYGKNLAKNEEYPCSLYLQPICWLIPGIIQKYFFLFFPYRTSVKEDLNVSGVFQHLAENYVNKIKSYNDPTEISNPPPLFQIGASSRTYSTSAYVTTNNHSKGPLYITKPSNTHRLPSSRETSSYVPSLYSNSAQQRPRVLNTVDRRYYG